MSNDKIYIKCKGCGKTTTFATYFPKTLSVCGEIVSLFVQKHQNCINHIGNDLSGNRCFDLMPESDDRFDLWIGDKSNDINPWMNKFYRLIQKENRGFNLSYIHTIIVRAKTEEKARNLAQRNEDEERDGLLRWDVENASCDIVYRDSDERVILVA